MNAFKNAFKVLGNRFTFLWTHIAYYTLAIFLIVSICASILIPYINQIVSVEDFNFIGRVSGMGQTIISGGGIDAFWVQFTQFFTELGEIFTSANYLPTFLLLLLVSVISRFVTGLAELAFYHVIDMHLSSAAKQSFRTSFIKNIGKSSVYQLSKMLFTLPFDLIIFLLVYVVTFTFSVPFLLWFAPFFTLLAFVLLYSLRLAMFSGWVPQMLRSERRKIFGSFFSSVALLKKNFGRVYGAMVLYMILIIAVNVFFGIFTLGVGLFITVPLSLYFASILNSTLYYQNANLRYYIDKNTIIN